MKLKELIYLLGLKPKPRHFGYVVESHDLPRDGRIDVAQWQHRGAYRVAPAQSVVDQWRRILGPGDVAVDIGAHAGDTALPMALAVGPSGTVLALEPNPNTFEVLARNAALNREKTNIVPLMIAAMRVDGPAEFQYGDGGYNNGGFHEGMSRWQHGSAYTLTVDGRNLQQLLMRDYPELIERIRMVKVDAEGFERPILETIEPLLRQQRPWLHVEVFDLKKSDPGERVRLFDFLFGLEYRVHRVRGDDDFAGEMVTRANLMQWRSFDVLCVPSGADLPING